MHTDLYTKFIHICPNMFCHRYAAPGTTASLELPRRFYRHSVFQFTLIV